MVDLDPHPLECLGDTLLGIGNVTDGGDPDVLLRRSDGSLVIVEANGYGGTRSYVCAGCFDGAQIVGLADFTGDGLTDLVGVTPQDEVLVFPHAGVFWPQDPSTTFGTPIMLTTRTHAAPANQPSP